MYSISKTITNGIILSYCVLFVITQNSNRGNLSNRGRGASASVQQQRSQALKALQQAKATLATINARTQAVNQKRGLQVITA